MSTQMRRGIRSATAFVVLVLATLGLAAPAEAAVVCTFAAPVATVTSDAGDAVTIVRSGDAIQVNGAPCGTATVTATDTISVTSNGVLSSVTIDLSGGAFAPGATAEPDESSEIEINLPNDTPLLKIVGSSGADHVVAGASGANLNADETTPDVDVALTGTPTIELDGGDGDDVLSIGGGAGTGDPVRGTLRGGLGNDTLIAGEPGSAIDGGDGTDTVDYSSATSVEATLATGQVTHEEGGVDTLIAIEGFVGSPGDDLVVGSDGDDTIDGADGSDTIDFSAASGPITADLRTGNATGQGADVVRNFENVVGSPQDDALTGGDEDNLLDGGDGDDTIDGGDGDDELVGGDGEDTVSFRSAEAKVAVTLKGGTAEGAGADTLEGFEHVVGSSRADEITGNGAVNRLEGRGGNDRISGRAGDDRILAGRGNDFVYAQGGDDVVLGEHGRDQLNGGKGKDHCKGGPGPDSFVLCENFPT